MITSTNNSSIVLLKKLQKDSKYRKDNNCYIIEGIRLLCDAVKYNKDIVMVYCVASKANSIPTQLQDKITIVEDRILSSISDTVASQGIIAVIRPSNAKDIGDKCLVLERLQDPGNMGTLMRSAVAFGYNSIIAVNCVDMYSPKVIRSAMSAHFACNIITVATLSEALALLSEHQLIVADMHGQYVEQLCCNSNIALLVGNEGNGVSQQAKQEAQFIVSLPMDNQLESLNVGVAGSILMYLLR